ncbi:FMN-binding negative transcriptional regulator [Longirhabdus pacifica]|uniref:FMN-binding negative transcriptional regulator n=1 Tax=Longirhabdus pacifica TaxID=2305227 RepID=UPI001008CCC9|nr:FMN-binding negative transcriptional regulator [Longirhabdus pacifica]
MYIPPYFKIKDQKMMQEIVEENGFATLFSQHIGEPFATHLPFMIDDKHEYLYTHMAAPNPQWKDIDNQNVLIVFQGPHCYISSSWYETKLAVPTWNYVTVHVYGVVEMMNDEELITSLNDVVNKYEGENSSYALHDVDEKYLEGMRKGIVGLKIKIINWEGKAKLSQNHSKERRNLVIDQLEKSPRVDEQKIAQYMRHSM